MRGVPWLAPCRAYLAVTDPITLLRQHPNTEGCMTRPSIDQTYLSPSGKVSERAKKAAQERVRAELFPPGYWDVATKALSAEHLRDQAANLRRLADLGMRPRVHRREAERLEAQAAAL